MGYIPQIVNNADKEDNGRVFESEQRDDFSANTGTLTTEQESGETTQAASCMTIRYTGLT